MIYGPIDYNGICRTKNNNVLYTLDDKLDTVKVMWLGYLFRMQELDPCRKLTFLNQKALDV
jgi:hypothetical protein